MFQSSVTPEEIEKLELAAFGGKITIIDKPGRVFETSENHWIRYGIEALFYGSAAEERRRIAAALRSYGGISVQDTDAGHGQETLPYIGR